MKRLENAIIGVALNLTITLNAPSDPEYFLNLKAATNAITRTPAKSRFRKILTLARKRFDANSIVGIRGCRAGATPDYLKAIANFFGSNSTKPKVTGPDFFQSFPTPDSTNFNAGDAAALISSKPKLKDELDHWAQVTNHATSIAPAATKLNSYCDRFVLPVRTVHAMDDREIRMKCLELASELETTVVIIGPGAIIGGIKGHAL